MKQEHYKLSFVKLALFVIAGIGLIGGGSYLSVQHVSAQNTPKDKTEAKTDEVISKDIISTLEKVENITLDTTIFTSKTFQSLQDYTVDIEEMPTGRSNPFAPYKEAPPTTKTSPR